MCVCVSKAFFQWSTTPTSYVWKSRYQNASDIEGTHMAQRANTNGIIFDLCCKHIFKYCPPGKAVIKSPNVSQQAEPTSKPV